MFKLLCLIVYTVLKYFMPSTVMYALRPSIDIFQSANSSASETQVASTRIKFTPLPRASSRRLVRLQSARHRRQHTNAIERPMSEITPHQQRPMISVPFFHPSLPINVENGYRYASRISLRHRIPFPRGTSRCHCSNHLLPVQRLSSLRDMVLLPRT